MRRSRKLVVASSNPARVVIATVVACCTHPVVYDLPYRNHFFYPLLTQPNIYLFSTVLLTIKYTQHDHFAQCFCNLLGSQNVILSSLFFLLLSKLISSSLLPLKKPLPNSSCNHFYTLSYFKFKTSVTHYSLKFFHQVY